MSLREYLARRVAEPAMLRYYQWRGDPVARWMRPRTKADPYPTYDDLRRRGLVRIWWATSPLRTDPPPMASIRTENPAWIVSACAWKNITICAVDLAGLGGGITRVSGTKMIPNRV
jgi:hypothetical protein